MEVLGQPLVLARVFSYLEWRDLCRAKVVCKAWQSSLSDSALLRERFKFRWGLKGLAGSARREDVKFYESARLSSFVRLHRLARSDTLASIAVRYKVSVSLLKQTNNLSSDGSMYCRKELYVPVQSEDDLLGSQAEIVYSQDCLKDFCVVLRGGNEGEDNTGGRLGERRAGAGDRVDGRRAEFLQNLMAKSLKIDDCEARYYLESCGYEMKQAMREFQADRDWEHNFKRAEEMGSVRRQETSLLSGIISSSKFPKEKLL
ncbi:LysM domain-containing protein [Chloropicon primus]|uniref:LysM domain-containing protein n=1 Tax=Chloropicon primus TaxID=1764295 RepID=A0A5B8MFE8_9CHLO|nr:hypothetical protein A3770_01p05380 [Chloropicon primus]UPQ97235.1 LysM domain-containing protein [Chloropicon primus]|mmetsp:Transcript_1443/g.4155  ORF Transcript_1443/g.4155 Transcript_1443/m.4155 type:complete len:259 (-) Transcript_1443:1351-2127(-)|eukprot:QDZ18020.1 hypothetical protein A3770_01p05380 [Chloropicon primus]